MRYEKPPLSFRQQAELLINRGLVADRGILAGKLKAVSYYRLSGYWYTFQNADNSFKHGANLATVWSLYTFDRQLRLLVMDAIERVEVSVRTSLTYHISHEYGPFGYANSANLPNLENKKFDEFLQKIEKETKHSKEILVKRFKGKYGDFHRFMPIWIVAEIMTFGTLLTLFRGVAAPIKQAIAGEFGVSDRVLESWLCALNGTRNICAHHGRLWNREFGYKPLIPKKAKHPNWHKPCQVQNNRVFAIVTILKYLMSHIAPQSKWQDRFDSLLAQYPKIKLAPMGFPENWRECPVWKKCE